MPLELKGGSPFRDGDLKINPTEVDTNRGAL